MVKIYLGVNYNSSSTLNATLPIWKSLGGVDFIYIVNSFSDNLELINIKKICSAHSAILIESENRGYGSGLNVGLDYILKNHITNYDKTVIFFGNIDIFPQSKIDTVIFEKSNDVLIPNIYQDNKILNPFLTTFQAKFLWILRLSSSLNSIMLMYLWIVIKKLLSNVPSTVNAIHGSLFILRLDQLKVLQPIFDERVFLYCEEMFYSTKVNRIGFRFKECKLNFEHIGSVSTGAYFKSKNKFRFQNWRNSMSIYFDKIKDSND